MAELSSSNVYGILTVTGPIVVPDTLYVDAYNYKVGIRTTEPEHQLETVAAGSTEYSVNAITLYNSGSVNYYPNLLLRKSRNNILGEISTTSTNDILGQISIHGVNTSGSFNTGARIYGIQNGTSGATYIPIDLRFATSDGTASYLDRMSITKDGFVGINTTNPQYGMLEVKPSTADANHGITLYTGSGNTARSWIDGSDKWIMSRGADGTRGITITPSPYNVGIGDTDPAYKLEVAGDTNITSTSYRYRIAGTSLNVVAGNGLITGGDLDPSATLTLGKPSTLTASTTNAVTSTSHTHAITGFSPTTHNHGTGTVNYVPKWTSTTTLGNSKLYDNGTNIGIGTTSPAENLDVVSSNNLVSLFSTTKSDYGRIVVVAPISGDAQISFAEGTHDSIRTKWTIGNDGSDADKLKIQPTFGAFSGSEIITVQSDGNIGIGTTAPSCPLDVQSTNIPIVKFKNGSTNGCDAIIEISGARNGNIGGETSGIRFTDYDDNFPGGATVINLARIYASLNSADGGDGQLHLDIYDGSTWKSAIAISPCSGMPPNVGIGKEPDNTHRLDVYGTINTSASYAVADTYIGKTFTMTYISAVSINLYKTSTPYGNLVYDATLSVTTKQADIRGGIVVSGSAG